MSMISVIGAVFVAISDFMLKLSLLQTCIYEELLTEISFFPAVGFTAILVSFTGDLSFRQIENYLAFQHCKRENNSISIYM